jgi:hypothetical protein
LRNPRKARASRGASARPRQPSGRVSTEPPEWDRASKFEACAGVPVFTLARIMGTSVRMIERHYGALLDGAGARIAEALDALDAKRDRAKEEHR